MPLSKKRNRERMKALRATCVQPIDADTYAKMIKTLEGATEACVVQPNFDLLPTPEEYYNLCNLEVAY